MANQLQRRIATRFLPASFRRWVRDCQRRYGLHWPPLGEVDFGALHRLSPISSAFGLDRGLHVSRYYIESFLSANEGDVRGRVLEFGDDRYTRMFGGGKVTRSDVLNVATGDPLTTIVADMTRAEHIPSNIFDCILCTQTLQMIFDVRAALSHLERILAPGGVLLVTTHGISQVGRFEGIDKWGEYWHFTTQSLTRLLAGFFPPDHVRITGYGNVLAAVAHLHGLTAEDLTAAELDHHDSAYEVIIGARAVKPAQSSTTNDSNSFR